MRSDVVTLGVSLLSILGAPLLVILFYLDGLIVGKVAPRATLFVVYVAISRPSVLVLSLVTTACVLAITIGQWTLYRGFNEDRPELFGVRQCVPYLDRVPDVVRSKVGEQRMWFMQRTFDRYGGIGLCVTNVIPGVRGFMSIPAGLSGYPVERFVVFSTIGNAVYMVALTAVALGVVEIVQFLSV